MLEGRIALVAGTRGGTGRSFEAWFAAEGVVVHAAHLTPEGTLAAHVEDGSWLM